MFNQTSGTLMYSSQSEQTNDTEEEQQFWKTVNQFKSRRAEKFCPNASRNLKMRSSRKEDKNRTEIHVGPSLFQSKRRLVATNDPSIVATSMQFADKNHIILPQRKTRMERSSMISP